MKPILAVAALSFSAGVLLPRQSAPAPKTYADTVHNFSLEVPRFEAPDQGATVLVAHFFAPPSEGMAPNVNVLVERNAYTAESYKKATLDGMQTMKMTINSQKELKVGGRDALLLDYEGKQGDKAMHWLALAVVEADRVLLTTCTAAKDQFPGFEKQFRACLASFKMTGAPKKGDAGK
jgi:hypothetical protein